MQIHIAWSTYLHAKMAVYACYATLTERLGAPPDMLFVYASAGYDWDVLYTTLRRIHPHAPLHAASSCLGEMTVEVYNEWTAGRPDDFLAGGTVLAATTLAPLGRLVGKIGTIPYYRLSHPEAVRTDGSLSLFTAVDEGDEIILMEGTVRSLVARAGRVARSALGEGHLPPASIAGALVVYCAGCMLAVRAAMSAVVGEVRQALGARPFLGTFTFGEQGCFAGGANHHGNLMISVVVFESDRGADTE